MALADPRFFDNVHHNLSHRWSRLYCSENLPTGKHKGSFNWFPSVQKNVGLVCIQSVFLQIYVLITNPDRWYALLEFPNRLGVIWFQVGPKTLFASLERTGLNAYLDDRSVHAKSPHSLFEGVPLNLVQLVGNREPKNSQGLQNWRRLDQTKTSLFWIFISNLECSSQMNRVESVGLKRGLETGRTDFWKWLVRCSAKWVDGKILKGQSPIDSLDHFFENIWGTILKNLRLLIKVRWFAITG